jgi:FMN phosphatase YigB (HAD superfamily)
MTKFTDWSQIEAMARQGRIEYVFCDLFDTLLIRPSVTYDAFIISKRNLIKRCLRITEKIVRAFTVRFTKHDFKKNFFGKLVLRLVWKDHLEDFDKLILRKNILAKLILLQSLKVKIFIVSNTEIPEALILLKLANSGLNHLQICTSGKYQLLKSQGLYEEVLHQYHISPASVVVIGDNRSEDLLSAEKAGIPNLHIQSFEDFIKPVLSKMQLKIISKDERGLAHLSNLVNWVNDNNEINLWEIVGFFYSSMLSNFIAHSVFDRIKYSQDTEVIFLSREGYLPYTSFRSRYKDSFTAHYLYVSRILLSDTGGREFIQSQVNFSSHVSHRCAIFDIGWRGRSISQVRDLLSIPGNNFFLALWPWCKGPLNSYTLLVPRWNIRRGLTLRKCPEILEFILAAPHKSMSSTEIVRQPSDSSEYQICEGFLNSQSYPIPDLSRNLIFRLVSELLSNPTYDQALFFGGIKHSVSGEQARSLLDKKPVLWVQGVRITKSANNYDIFQEYVRRLVSFVKQ